MCIEQTFIDANLFSVKKYKNRVITIFNFKVCPPGPSESFIVYTYMVYLHNICKWEAGSRMEIYFTIENGDDPIFLNFSSLNISGIRECEY